jgi:hypothetical protein
MPLQGAYESLMKLPQPKQEDEGIDYGTAEMLYGFFSKTIHGFFPSFEEKAEFERVSPLMKRVGLRIDRMSLASLTEEGVTKLIKRIVQQ